MLLVIARLDGMCVLVLCNLCASCITNGIFGSFCFDCNGDVDLLVMLVVWFVVMGWGVLIDGVVFDCLIMIFELFVWL